MYEFVDDVHNVLDIVLAKIFRKFYESYNNDNQYVDEGTREKLLDRFQRGSVQCKCL